MSTPTLTLNELLVLKAIDESEYGDGLCDAVWTFTIEQNSSLSGRIISGTVSSLHKKGFVVSCGAGSEQQIEITRSGAYAYINANGGPSKKGFV